MSALSPTPVFLPGLICDRRVFAECPAAFPHALVVPGYGTADTLGAMAEQVIAAMPATVALVGHSMGARVALEIVRRVPERVARLVMASTGVQPVRPGEAEQRHRLRDLGRAAGMGALVDAWLPPMLGPAARRDPALVGKTRTMCVEAGLAMFERHIEALLARPTVEDLLSRIACPVLLVTGSEDVWSPPEQHRGIAAAIPHARLEVIEGAGHMLPLEQPGLFLDQLKAFSIRFGPPSLKRVIPA